jgi:hypothetical protein
VRKDALQPVACEPAKWELADATAVQAVAAGTADAIQQKRALNWIIQNACETYGLGWHPASAHEADFVAGRRFGGLQIVKLLHINVAAMRRKENA